MATLNDQQAIRLNELLNTDSGSASPEAAAFKDPATRAEAERLLTEYATEKAPKPKDIAAQVQRVAAGPGVQMENFAHGAQDILYGGAMLGMDLLRAITPDESEVNQTLTTNREALAQARYKAEDEHEARVQAVGGQYPGIVPSVLTETLPKIAGEITPILRLPTGLSTYWRTVGYNGVLSAGFVGAADKHSTDLLDRIGELSTGGIAGLVLSGVIHAPQGFRAYASRKINKALKTDLAKANLALEKDIQRITGVEDFSFDLGEVTANPFIQGLQTASAREATRLAQNKRINTLIEYFKIRSNQLSTAGSKDSIAEDLNYTIETINTQLQARASSNFATGMDNVITKFGPQNVIDGKHYLSEAQRLLEEFTNPALGGSTRGAPKFLVEQIDMLDQKIYPAATREIVVSNGDGGKRLMWEVVRKDNGLSLGKFSESATASRTQQAYNDTHGGVDAETTGELLRSFGRIARGDVTMFENAQPGTARNLSNALKSAMITSLEGSGNKLPEAVDAIQSLRKIYATDQATINGVNNSLLKGVFGVDDISAVNAETAFLQLVGRSEKAQQKTAALLADINPELLADIQAVQIRHWVDNSFRASTKQSLLPFNPSVLAEQLAGKTGAEGGAARGMFGAKDRLHMRRVGQALRTINETYLSNFPEAAATELQNASINLMSRNPAFFARWMASVFSSSETVERMLLDPAARESIIKLAESGLGTRKAQAAIIYLSVTAAEWAAGDKAAETRAKEKELSQIRQANPRP